MLSRFALLLVGALGASGCGGAPTPQAIAFAVPAGRTIPAPEGGAVTVVAFAEAQVGKPYCWGGRGPRCFDCSGLVQTAWGTAHVALPRTAGAQARGLDEVPLARMRPGDILWWPHHVGLYVGNGQMIDAYHKGAGVIRRRVVVPQRVLRVHEHGAEGR